MSLGQGGLSGSGGAGRDSLGTFLGAGTASDLGSCSLGTAEQQGNIKSVSKMDLLEQVAGSHQEGLRTPFPVFPPWGHGTCTVCAECEQLQAGKCQHPQLHPALPILPPIGQTCFYSVPTGALDPTCPPELAGDDLPDLLPGPWRPKPLRGRDKPVGWHLAGGDMWWCPQAVAGAASTAAFFLCEGLLGRHFDVVPNGVAEPQPGDLFLFPLASGGPGWWGAHAGVYCGDGEIIHLEASPCDHQPSLKAIPSTTQAPQEHPQQGLWPSMVRATS
eukprot:XP_015134317.1 uncharacterized protein LOC415324 isoform X2 [Gallus gallus]